LTRLGYAVTVYEAFAKAGGMLRYGIPDYRLPPEVLDAEIKRLTDAGIKIVTGTCVGRDIPYEKIKQEHDAVFVGIGAHKGKVLGVPGEDAENVMTGTGFLNLVNQGQAVDVGDHVIVIGGGDTAIDAARISRRLGAEVTIVYRRTETEMPAIAEEIREARNEGVKIEFLAAPLEVLRANGRAAGMRFQRMELGEPDSSGRRRPVPVAGSEFSLDASFIIPAISQEPDFAPLEHLHEGKEWVKIDADGKAGEDHTYAGGDAVELGLVTIALAQGRQAADAIHRAFRGLPHPEPAAKPKVDASMLNRDFWERKPRADEELLPVGERLAAIGREVAETISAEQARAEASRCMSCGLCFDCENCFKFCQDNAVVRPLNKGEKYSFKLEFCQGCKKCAEQCPCGYIDMK
jgi:NADPH-dependent glutamate synthase beta subunit-like oxidoreductase